VLVGVQHTVGAPVVRAVGPARIGPRIAQIGAVVTFLHPPANQAVAASGRKAPRGAGVGFVIISIVALLACDMVRQAVSAQLLSEAVRTAQISGFGVPVVAFFADGVPVVHDSVSTPR
jgi:hypothetical protein